MYCIIGAHRFMGLFQPFFLQKVSCTSEWEGKFHAGTSLWNMCMEAAASCHCSSDGTLGSKPYCLNFLKQSLLGYGGWMWPVGLGCVTLVLVGREGAGI